MDHDRAVQAFFARFPETVRREAERFRAEGAIKQIFGSSSYVQARAEDLTDVYRITLRLRNNIWEYELRGPADEHPALICATMMERIVRGTALPESPNEVENLSLTARLEKALGRELAPEEDRFIDKLERRYKKYSLDEALFDTDLVRLNPKWPVESYDPITLWPTPPADIIEFWNYIASAFDKKKLSYPRFMASITDRDATRNKLQSWEEQRDAAEWSGRFEQILSQPALAPEPVSLRLRVTTREARLQMNTGESWEAIPNDLDAQRLSASLDEGKQFLDPTSRLLWTLWKPSESSGEPAPASRRVSSPETPALLGRLFALEPLHERLVTLDETPFHRSTEPLRWACSLTDETSAAPSSYLLQLLEPDGESVPYNLILLPGVQPLYLSDDGVFPGPIAWTQDAEVSPRVEIPRRVLESEEGFEFLNRLGAEPPEALHAMAVETTLLPTFNFRLVKRGSADSEVVHCSVTASDAEESRQEILERDQWRVINRQPTTPGRLTVVDRNKLVGINKMLDQGSLIWDAPQGCFRARITKTFPEKFAEWLSHFPSDFSVALDPELASLKADPIQASVRFELAEANEIDWFDLKILVNVEGLDLTKAQIRDLVAARGGFVRMPDGKWMRLSLTLTDEQQKSITRLGLDVYDLSGEAHRMHTLQLADPGAKEIFDDRAWEKICERANNIKLQVRPAVPPELALELRPYQIDGFHFLAYLAVNNFGGLLADDMGLGKTAQSLTWLLWLRNRHRDTALEKNPKSESAPPPIPPTLVVAPKSVLDVWANECKKFAPQLRVQVVRNKDDLNTDILGTQVDVLVMNYSQLRVNTEKVKSVSWLATILDEGQQIKNPDSMAARAARELDVGHRLVLSGTPIENRLLDVWSLMAFAMPGVLGNRKYFKDRFDRRKDPDAQVRLSARLRPFILRRTKGQVALDLPPKTEEEVYCKMEDSQEEIYRAELLKMQRLVLGFDSDATARKNSFAVLQGLMRLRQICCHPGLIDPSLDDTHSSKMTALFYLLDQLREEGHKVLVFSQFVSMLEIIQKRLEEEKRDHVILTGQSKDRGAIVEKFQTSKEPTVFLLSLKAGGSGLNLTAASYVILYDPWWNPAAENQAIDRTHRIGQTNPVIAYRLLVRDTIEEKIRLLQQQKQLLFTGVLGEESFAQNLGVDDMKYLFGTAESME